MSQKLTDDTRQVDTLLQDIITQVLPSSAETAQTLAGILGTFRATMAEALARAPGLSGHEKALVDAKEPIEAIKAYRARTGATLKESKDLVDRYRDELERA